MIISVGDDVLTNSIDCDACQAIEFTFAITKSAKFFNEFTILIEYLQNVMGNRVMDANTYFIGLSVQR